ncbi:MAG: gamma-glutamylcyclotransferase [Roseiarcus sp.]
MFQESQSGAGATRERDEFWVFGYGSLIWNPGFEFAERRGALLFGWTRRLCVWSHVYRGAPEAPGLVFGLDAGGECFGVAYRVEARRREATLDYLRERELVTNVYLEIEAEAELDAGERVRAVTYAADTAHPQYAGLLPRERALEIVRRSRGKSGPNADYLLDTHAEFARLGIVDAELDWLCERLAG